MRRYPFAVPGFVHLTSAGGPAIVDRLRGAMEPLVMALLHRFDAGSDVRVITTDEMDTREGEDWPKEWWLRTAFIPTAAPDPINAKERAWMTVEYSRWEDSEDWTMQAFFRVAEVEFSLSTDSDASEPVLNLVGTKLPAGDIRVVEEVLRAHFGGPAANAPSSAGAMPHTVAL